MNSESGMMNEEGMGAIASSAGLEALRGKTVVVKYGGAAMGAEYSEALFAADAVRLRDVGVKLVVVHGGGNEATALAARLGVEAEFVAGHRRTSDAMLDVVVMALAGRVNKSLVGMIAAAGGTAIGLSGADGRLLLARKRESSVDLGNVGEVIAVNVELLELLASQGMIPVIAPIGIGSDGALYNINADLAAGAVAGALAADAFIYMSNIAGIEVDGNVARAMTSAEARLLMERGTITGGMIPKVESAFAALLAGARTARIVDGRVPHAIVNALTDAGVGTEIVVNG